MLTGYMDSRPFAEDRHRSKSVEPPIFSQIIPEAPASGSKGKDERAHSYSLRKPLDEKRQLPAVTLHGLRSSSILSLSLSLRPLESFPLPVSGMSGLGPAGTITSATDMYADRVNSERLQLLTRKRGEGDLSPAEESRLEDLTRRVQRLLPRVTDQDWGRLEQMVALAESFQRRLRQIQQKHGLGDLP